MTIVERSTSIAAPVDAVYRTSQDYAVRHAWDPFPERISVVGGEPGDAPVVGMRVDVVSKLGMAMRVQFVQLDPPARAAVSMVEGPWFLARFAGSWVFKAVTPELTTARFRYTVVARPAALRWLIEPAAALYFGRAVEKRLSGLKAYCERHCGAIDAAPTQTSTIPCRPH